MKRLERDSTAQARCSEIFMTRHDAETAIGSYIDGFYNPVQRYSSLDFVSPTVYEGLAA